ncbi:hypothetical protein KQ875_00665 [Mycoplasma zalophi]|uniref:Endonuclease/exonuclease/phosphatase domain-containing protein n=1 Tax=Mycoplasma zalophi TaxID=191287 RepID=A0ABS6DQI2_9MOLU|nr:hypothetical protein [Mycoplasma zalophi]MBU4692110.1 hypothetical protein [Mycoplasma zalophi]
MKKTTKIILLSISIPVATVATSVGIYYGVVNNSQTNKNTPKPTPSDKSNSNNNSKQNTDNSSEKISTETSKENSNNSDKTTNETDATKKESDSTKDSKNNEDSSNNTNTDENSSEINSKETTSESDENTKPAETEDSNNTSTENETSKDDEKDSDSNTNPENNEETSENKNDTETSKDQENTETDTESNTYSENKDSGDSSETTDPGNGSDSSSEEADSTNEKESDSETPVDTENNDNSSNSVDNTEKGTETNTDNEDNKDSSETKESNNQDGNSDSTTDGENTGDSSSDSTDVESPNETDATEKESDTTADSESNNDSSETENKDTEEDEESKLENNVAPYSAHERSAVNSLGEDETIFVRPPFAAKFLLKANNKDITVVFDHLDSPGQRKASKSKEKYEFKPSKDEAKAAFPDKAKNIKISNQGAQEFSEFLAIEDLLKYYKGEFKSSLTIFGGDTNIHKENFSMGDVFSDNVGSTLDRNLEIFEKNGKKKDWNEKYLTSLGNKGDNYSEQYDKMFFINDDEANFGVEVIKDQDAKQFKIDTYKTFEYFISKEILKRLEGYKNDYKMGDSGIIKYGISDHAPVFTDINLKNVTKINTIKVDKKVDEDFEGYRKKDNTIRIAHWNILNFHGGEMKSTAIAHIIYKSGFDIIGLTEIDHNEGSRVQEIVDKLNELVGSQRFKCVIQNAKDTEVPEFLVESKRFGDKQEEEVAIIYDSENFKYKNSKTFAKKIRFFASDKK